MSSDGLPEENPPPTTHNITRRGGDHGYARRFVARPGRLIDAFQTMRNVEASSAFRDCSQTAGLALLTALLKWADADGRWQVKRATWAAALGVSVRTLARAVDELTSAQLVWRQPYLRPKMTGQGSSIYTLVSSLVARDDTYDRPSGALPRVTSMTRLQGVTPVSPPQGLPRVTSRNAFLTGFLTRSP